ncbi:glycosyltransferase family 2 protein [Paenibacillus sp. B2(2019)]|uniref:glycosyltransferase family 2 protein n=1 Tax=Paenibacillus sp. B2(2019) TaxID=2607754 RepID=UPI0011F26100|nr:glycosyltransferase [Paenibacillus sp. B2(2019)]KAA1184215.1 glycosyltransferase family 2 protein [Paenibacillus sp. B2(2019)]
MTENKIRVLIGSPIHQKPMVLKEFLNSLLRLNIADIELDFHLVDDNDDEESSRLLQEFQSMGDHIYLQSSGFHDAYIRNDTTHFWNTNLVWKVANFKNLMINRAQTLNYDYLFLIDSDLILHPDTLRHLIGTNKDIISEVFWTQWQPETMFQPQVWMHDEYNQWELLPGEKLQPEEINRRFHEFIAKMRIPGIYEVGGLGACTLISQHAIKAGVSYNQIRNISYWGEDRHFCIRAAALGIPLFVDTHYPALHLYRDSDLSKVEDFIKETTETKAEATDTENSSSTDELPASVMPTPTTDNPDNESSKETVPPARKRPKLTLTMVVKNESGRFLRQVLEEHRKYIDEAVIIDDGSTDNSAAICLEVLEGIPVHLVHNTISKFSNEIELRKQQWEEVLKTKPEWILSLDADEIFEASFAANIEPLLYADEVDLFCFRLYDLWNATHYREDIYWRSHLNYRPFLLRYKEDFNYVWNESPQHCGRFPENVFELPHQLSNLRLKHLGWSKAEFRLEKYLRYMLLDPDGQYGWKEQYLSILDEHPHLIPWVE